MPIARFYIKSGMLLLLLTMYLTASATSIVSVRDLFYRASKSSNAADSLLEQLERTDISKEPVLIGYKGMAQLLVCYHSYNPYTKFKYFSKGKQSLEEAIYKDPENIELRFLRLSVQLNAPAFLLYNKKIEEDKRKIFSGLKIVKDRDLFKRISDYTLTAKRITKEEKVKVKEAMMDNKNFYSTK